MSEYVVEVRGQLPDTVYKNEEIVRCGDCINGASDGTLCTLNSILKPVNVEPNGFCYWGERK